MLSHKCLQIVTPGICQNKREFHLCNMGARNSGWCRSPASTPWRQHLQKHSHSIYKGMHLVNKMMKMKILWDCAEHRAKVSNALKTRSETTNLPSSPTICRVYMCWIPIPIRKLSLLWKATRSSSRWIVCRESLWTRGIHSQTRIRAPATRECPIWIRPKLVRTKSIIAKPKLKKREKSCALWQRETQKSTRPETLASWILATSTPSTWSRRIMTAPWILLTIL